MNFYSIFVGSPFPLRVGTKEQMRAEKQSKFF